tara:strand:- start:9531 stop:10679 length:1149 start_codon:yes stop_codon:yes gene_type:complete
VKLEVIEDGEEGLSRNIPAESSGGAEDGQRRYMDKEMQGDNPFGTQAKVLLHLPVLAQYLQTGDVDGPVFMEINPTNRCNLRCSWCISENSRGTEELEIGALERFFEDFAEMGGKALTFSGGGEPTFYREFVKAVKSAKATGVDLGIMTDGIYKKEYNDVMGESMQWARFSLDTLDRDNYKFHKKRDGVPEVLENIAALKDTPVRVGINCNLGDNLKLKEVKGLYEWFVAEKPADYLQFRPILPRYFKGEVPLINEESWEYLDSVRGAPGVSFSHDKVKDIKANDGFPKSTCEGHYLEPVLHATGEVQVCMYHPRNDDFTFGNIHDSSFKEIWASEKRQRAIEHTRGVDYAEKCQFACKLHEVNKLFHFVNHPDETMDRNFL